MPYDCVVLTNILNYVCWKLYIGDATLHWTIDSLHYPIDAQRRQWSAPFSCLLPPSVLDDPGACWRILEGKESLGQPWEEILRGGLHT
jgi:hypothetical protein